MATLTCWVAVSIPRINMRCHTLDVQPVLAT